MKDRERPSEIIIAPDNPLAEHLKPLLDASYSELAERYAEAFIFTASPSEMAAANCLILAARQNDVPVGCIGLVPLTDDSAEIKRLFVAAVARRHGLGRRLVTALEAAAARAGYCKLLLETGIQQPEAICLYESLGYRPIAPFGQYVESPYSLCYEKPLDVGEVGE